MRGSGEPAAACTGSGPLLSPVAAHLPSGVVKTSRPLDQWCEKTLGHRFADPAWLDEALMHRSYANEAGLNLDNQRLEFLGDAVVGLVMGEYLFRQYTALSEGELSRLRAAVIREGTLARRARALGVGAWLQVGRGEAASGGRERESTLADAFEALVGAIYLDAGLAAARAFTLRELAPEVEAARQTGTLDCKTQLQEHLQKQAANPPVYRVLAEEGPVHQRTFVVEVVFQDRVLGQGRGRSKKEAEQEAARMALAALRQGPHPSRQSGGRA